MDPNGLPQATFEVTKWTSDAYGAAYIFGDPVEGSSITITSGLGRKEAQDLGQPQDYPDNVGPPIPSPQTLIKKSGNAFGYIMASARLQIETGYSMLKGTVIVSI